MTHGQVIKRLRGGITACVMIYSFALLFGGSGLAYSPPEGLPDSPEIPDLYDPEIVKTYLQVAKRPYEVKGHLLAPWLIATVLTPKAVHVGPPRISATQNAVGGQPKDVILVIGYLTDARDGRIIALTETFGHPDNDTRSIKAWVDQGWVTKGKGSGDWGPPMLSEVALTRQETAAFMEPVYRLIETGFQQTLKR